MLPAEPIVVCESLPFLVHLILYFFQVDTFIQLDLRLDHIAGGELGDVDPESVASQPNPDSHELRSCN